MCCLYIHSVGSVSRFWASVQSWWTAALWDEVCRISFSVFLWLPAFWASPSPPASSSFTYLPLLPVSQPPLSTSSLAFLFKKIVALSLGLSCRFRVNGNVFLKSLFCLTLLRSSGAGSFASLFLPLKDLLIWLMICRAAPGPWALHLTAEAAGLCPLQEASGSTGGVWHPAFGGYRKTEFELA